MAVRSTQPLHQSAPTPPNQFSKSAIKYQSNNIKSVLMSEPFPFETIQFRNGLYQGQVLQQRPHSLGFFLDDDLLLHCSTWESGSLNHQTAILVSHSKYMYGDWKQGKPNGVNIFRMGDTVLIGNFESGTLVGDFVIIFERQNFAVVAYSSHKGVTVQHKKSFRTEEQLKGIVSDAIDNSTLSNELFSFVVYLKTNFCRQNGAIGMTFDEGLYHFGFRNGLGVMFDDDNFISKVGVIDVEGQMCGMGALFESTIEVGNFENGLVIKYKEGQKPAEEIKNLFKNEHRKSIYFKNDFVFTTTAQVLLQLEKTIKDVILGVSEQPMDTDRSITQEELNESLEYRPRSQKLHSEENQRLRQIRESLYKSVGKPIDIKPSSFEGKASHKYPEAIKQMHFSKVEEIPQQKHQSMSFSGQMLNPSLENRRDFIEGNKLIDYIHTPVTSSRLNKNYEYQKSPLKLAPSLHDNNPHRSDLKLHNSTSYKERPNHPSSNVTSFKAQGADKRIELTDKYPNPLDDSLESPYNNVRFNQSTRRGPSKEESKKEEGCREYIPISHTKEHPQRNKEKFKDIIRASPDKYKEVIRTSSPLRNETLKPPPEKYAKPPTTTMLSTPERSHQKETIYLKANHTEGYVSKTGNSRVSPIKNPFYQKQDSSPVKQPPRLAMRSKNPYLSEGMDFSPQRESPERREKLMEKMGKKYHYVEEGM